MFICILLRGEHAQLLCPGEPGTVPQVTGCWVPHCAGRKLGAATEAENMDRRREKKVQGFSVLNMENHEIPSLLDSLSF